MIARYFLVWHRWLYEDNDDLPIFLGTILFRSISRDDNLRRLVELVHLDGGHLTRIFLSNTTTVMLFRRSGTNPTSYFIPAETTLETIKDLLLPFIENVVKDLDKEMRVKEPALLSKKPALNRAENLFESLQKKLGEQATSELLAFTSRERISQISGFSVAADRGIVLKPHGAASRVISEDKVRSLYDNLVRIDASADEINEAVRRYYTTFKDKESGSPEPT